MWIEEKKYECQRCHRIKKKNQFHSSYKKKGIVSWCKLCRSKRYYELRYKELCKNCTLARKLFKNKICVECNEKKGLRECRECSLLLPIDLQYHEGRKTCIECRKTKRKTRATSQKQT